MKRRFAASLILLATTACDNVEWGGIDVQLESPPAASDTLRPPEPEAPPEPQGPVLPEGPVLFAAQRQEDGRVVVRALASVGQDTLVPLPLERDQPGFSDLLARERMAVGTRYILFAEGVRVGSVRVDEVDYRPGLCSSEPVSLGPLEIIPDAAGVTRFVALREEVAGDRPYTPYQDPNHNYDQRVAGLNMAADYIRDNGVPWPGSVLETRADMQALPLDGDPRGAMAATFLFQDALRVGRSLTQAAWSIFVLGVGGPVSYRPGYIEYRRVEDGKAATRYFEQADWDGDGQTEILLEIFGEDARWMAALDRRDGAWAKVFEASCDAGAAGS